MVPEFAWRVALLGAALLLIAFFAAAETALLALRPAAWLPWLEQGQCRGRLWARLHRHQPVVRGTMMTGGVATVYLFGYLATCLMLDLNVTWSPVIGFLLSAVIVVPLGVALPVNYTAQRPEGVAIALAWPITVISVLLWPVTFLLRGLMRLVLLARGVTRVELHAPPTEEELRTMLAQSDKQGVLPEQQRQMLADLAASCDAPTGDIGDMWEPGTPHRMPESAPDSLSEHLAEHYRELLRAYVIMGSGNLATEMERLAETLTRAAVTPQQAMLLHLQVLEDMISGLGSRSARHVMNRADMLVLEVMIHLAEEYRTRYLKGAGTLPPVTRHAAASDPARCRQ